VDLSSADNALFVGGGTGAGKTTLAHALAVRHGLRAFHLDAFWYAYEERAGERAPPPDVQWLEWTPRTQAADFERISRRMLAYALDDLKALPEQPPVLVVGPQVLPDALPADANAVFLVPTAAFQHRVLSPRPMPSSDPERALAARLVKDRLYAERVAELARERGFPVLEIDGARGPEEIREVVERMFAPLLAAAEPVDLAPVRRWENETVARNVRSWIASPSGPDRELTYSFVCECGRRGCGEHVRLRLDEFDAAPRVLAPAHGA
jgi:hypothetical protein